METEANQTMNSPINSNGKLDPTCAHVTADRPGTIQINTDSGNDNIPKEATGSTKDAIASMGCVGDASRYTKVPLRRSKPIIPAAAVQYIHMAIAKERNIAITGSVCHAATPRRCTKHVLNVPITINCAKYGVLENSLM